MGIPCRTGPGSTVENEENIQADLYVCILLCCSDSCWVRREEGVQWLPSYQNFSRDRGKDQDPEIYRGQCRNMDPCFRPHDLCRPDAESKADSGGEDPVKMQWHKIFHHNSGSSE